MRGNVVFLPVCVVLDYHLAPFRPTSYHRWLATSGGIKPAKKLLKCRELWELCRSATQSDEDSQHTSVLFSVLCPNSAPRVSAKLASVCPY
ncbi:hypothetical protein CEXT_470291 [Caerostris extrusa]|uniref:Secreted protein n=1 Tax=Caerostris extrusa TaxID=172846 RepID=A0AAV4QH86_CAEEX|nr:hypothetical protein CEXT_470291 [Caerostris extrusa]